MSSTITNENTLTTKNPLQNSLSADRIHHDNLISSRFAESLPIMQINSEETTPIRSNLSRFPESIFFYFS
ncbi:unnamed protein product [Rotaria sp. Silwood1]|nr:unnamed protein product [Rotaria sp. Silwood1]